MRHLHTGAGYLLNDDRASGGAKTEADVLGCPHCQKLIVGAAGRQSCGFCVRCGAPICGACAARYTKPDDQGGGCQPFARRVEEQLARLHRRRALSRAFGLQGG